RARDALAIRLPAKFAFATYLAGHTRHFGGKRAKLIDHRVDRVLELENLALHIDSDFSREIAICYRRSHIGDVAHLRGQVSGHGIHRVSQIFPSPRHAADNGLTTEFAFGTHLTGDTCYFGGE